MQRGSAGGAGDDEWAKGRWETGEGQISGEQIPHRSGCVSVIKEITASDEGNCKGTRITFLCIVRGGSQAARSKGNERRFLRGCEETS